jgi:two-component system sensor histidine kinase KdpD
MSNPSDDFNRTLIHMAIHDLRAPLSSILSGIEIALTPDLPPNDASRVLQLCHDSTSRLLRQVESLLDIGQMQDGRMSARLAAHDVLPIVDEAVSMLRNTLDHTGIAVEQVIAQPLPAVLLDPELTRRVLVNLLDNAIHHTGGTRRIRIIVRQAAPDRVEVCVDDNGRGVSEADRERLFKLGGRTAITDTGRKGFGWGLPFCKLAAEAQGGMMHVENANDGMSGARFVLGLRTA